MNLRHEEFGVLIGHQVKAPEELAGYVLYDPLDQKFGTVEEVFVNYCHLKEEAACHSKFRPSEARKERRMRPAPTTDDISSVYPVTTRYTRELLGRLTQIANLSPKRIAPDRKPTPYATLTDVADYSGGSLSLPTSHFHCLIVL